MQITSMSNFSKMDLISTNNANYINVVCIVCAD